MKKASSLGGMRKRGREIRIFSCLQCENENGRVVEMQSEMRPNELNRKMPRRSPLSSEKHTLGITVWITDAQLYSFRGTVNFPSSLFPTVSADLFTMVMPIQITLGITLMSSGELTDRLPSPRPLKHLESAYSNCFAAPII